MNDWQINRRIGGQSIKVAAYLALPVMGLVALGRCSRCEALFVKRSLSRHTGRCRVCATWGNAPRAFVKRRELAEVTSVDLVAPCEPEPERLQSELGSRLEAALSVAEEHAEALDAFFTVLDQSVSEAAE